MRYFMDLPEGVRRAVLRLEAAAEAVAAAKAAQDAAEREKDAARVALVDVLFNANLSHGG